jgi:NTE family protein
MGIRRGICFSGGGDKGAFSVGVAKRLLDIGNVYDIYSGTSTGSLIAPLLAMGRIELLENVYMNTGREKIISSQGPLINVVYEGSVYDVRPLGELIEEHYTEAVCTEIMNMERDIYVCTICMENGEPVYFTNRDSKGGKRYSIRRWKDTKEIRRSIFASCCQPVLMSPVEIDGFHYCDGGVREYVPAEILIKNGAEAIDVILTTPENARGCNFLATETIYATLISTINILTHDVGDNDLRLTELYNQGIAFVEDIRERVLQQTGMSPEILDGILGSAKNPFGNKRHFDLRIFRPETYLGDGLEFDIIKMRKMFTAGYWLKSLTNFLRKATT